MEMLKNDALLKLTCGATFAMLPTAADIAFHCMLPSVNFFFAAYARVLRLLLLPFTHFSFKDLHFRRFLTNVSKNLSDEYSTRIARPDYLTNQIVWCAFACRSSFGNG